jgi:arylsulfatase A-like enzyme
MIRVLVLLAVIAAWAPSPAGAQPPNIVFVLADDLGFGDLGCYGHPYARTPNLDRLAREGTRFTRFYVTGVTCCPSRTGFMTGRHPASFAAYPANGGFGEQITVTELLKKAGYVTGHFGKWHIGPETAAGTYGIDAIHIAGGSKRDERGRDASLFDEAIRFIEANRERPFYVNVWGHITHHPVDPPATYAERFRDVTVKEDDFPAAMREKFAAVRARGGDVDAAMRNYLGDVASLDDAVGRLLARLDELGMREKTIVVFSSDHGSPAVPLEEKPPNPRRPQRDGRDDPARFALSLNLMGFNGGLRGGKHGMYEGGVRVPLIIRWPGRVPAGRVDEVSVASGIDWLPTLCALAGVTIDLAEFDGEDVSAAWLGKEHIRTRPLIWKTSNAGSPAGIRDGRWKLILPTRPRGEIELYDLAADPEEAHNVAPQHADVVQRLSEKIQNWTATLPKEYLKTDDPEN